MLGGCSGLRDPGCLCDFYATMVRPEPYDGLRLIEELAEDNDGKVKIRQTTDVDDETVILLPATEFMYLSRSRTIIPFYKNGEVFFNERLDFRDKEFAENAIQGVSCKK